MIEILEAFNNRLLAQEKIIDELITVSELASNKLADKLATAKIRDLNTLQQGMQRATKYWNQPQADWVEIVIVSLSIPIVGSLLMGGIFARNPSICPAPPNAGTLDNPIFDTNWRHTKKCLDDRQNWEKVFKPIVGVSR